VTTNVKDVLDALDLATAITLSGRFGESWKALAGGPFGKKITRPIKDYLAGQLDIIASKLFSQFKISAIFSPNLSGSTALGNLKVTVSNLPFALRIRP